MPTANFGALPVPGGVRFRLWAPAARDLTLVLQDGRAKGEHRPTRDPDGVFDLVVPGAHAGDRYGYVMDGRGPLPDPASRFQPDGVHETSQVVDPRAFEWTDGGWKGHSPTEIIVYELHVGTFTSEGTFAGVEARLPYLADLGVTAIELMPVADFAGSRNWGYDGVALYAPSRAYGRPDDLRRLVDAAHGAGISVILDVVYNHLGPRGAYLPSFNPQYLTAGAATPWGSAVTLQRPHATMVRRFILDNAVQWIRDYHVDGLRLDATHTLIDHTPRHIVREIAAAVRDGVDRPILIHAEDYRNMAVMVSDDTHVGWGLDGFWADDFHHTMRRLLAGDTHGYYRDYVGTNDEIARILRQGWLFTGQYSTSLKEYRGTDPSRTELRRSVVCLQNHDQVGNRAMGERLHHQIAPEVWRAASTVLLTAPMTPLLFMGQEWSASTPFRFFTDHEPDLGRLVTEGRRREFATFPEFAAADARTRIPDPQAASTCEASRLRWSEIDEPRHASVLALYRALIALRLTHPAFGASNHAACRAEAIDGDGLVIKRSDSTGVFWVVVRLKHAGAIDLNRLKDGGPGHAGTWQVLMTTEELPYAVDPVPPTIDSSGIPPTIRFQRAGAVILTQPTGG